MWKIFTHDYRSPIQGGSPVWDGSFPFDLPPVALDEGPATCGAGWNYCQDLATALQIAGLWPDGWSSHIVNVTPIGKTISRGEKSRTDQLRLERPATAAELTEGIGILSRPFKEHADTMQQEQLAWRTALARPVTDHAMIRTSLEDVLLIRSLNKWHLTQYETVEKAGEAGEAWTAQEARAARNAWAAGETRSAREVWEAQEAQEAWEAWVAWVAQEAWETWEAWRMQETWEARETWAAWDARAALMVCYASSVGWIHSPPDLLSRGIRDAYQHGLEATFPTGPQELGWVAKAE